MALGRDMTHRLRSIAEVANRLPAALVTEKLSPSVKPAIDQQRDRAVREIAPAEEVKIDDRMRHAALLERVGQTHDNARVDAVFTGEFRMNRWQVVLLMPDPAGPRKPSSETTAPIFFATNVIIVPNSPKDETCLPLAIVHRSKPNPNNSPTGN